MSEFFYDELVVLLSDGVKISKNSTKDIFNAVTTIDINKDIKFILLPLSFFSSYY